MHSLKIEEQPEGGQLLPGSVIRHYRRGHLVLPGVLPGVTWSVTWSVTWCYLSVAWRYLGFILECCFCGPKISAFLKLKLFHLEMLPGPTPLVVTCLPGPPALWEQPQLHGEAHTQHRPEHKQGAKGNVKSERRGRSQSAKPEQPAELRGVKCKHSFPPRRGDSFLPGQGVISGLSLQSWSSACYLGNFTLD